MINLDVFIPFICLVLLIVDLLLIRMCYFGKNH